RPDWAGVGACAIVESRVIVIRAQVVRSVRHCVPIIIGLAATDWRAVHYRVTPGKAFPAQAASGGFFPLRLRRQPPATGAWFHIGRRLTGLIDGRETRVYVIYRLAPVQL